MGGTFPPQMNAWILGVAGGPASRPWMMIPGSGAHRASPRFSTRSPRSARFTLCVMILPQIRVHVHHEHCKGQESCHFGPRPRPGHKQAFPGRESLPPWGKVFPGEDTEVCRNITVPGILPGG